MYLMNQKPLPINSNPGMIFPREQFADEDAQLKFTSRLISGIIDYKLVIDGYFFLIILYKVAFFLGTPIFIPFFYV